MAEKNSLWKNIRNKAAQNKRTGTTPKKPTTEMLRQERKIKAKQYAEGGLAVNDEEDNRPVRHVKSADDPAYRNYVIQKRLAEFSNLPHSHQTYLMQQDNFKNALNDNNLVSLSDSAWNNFLNPTLDPNSSVFNNPAFTDPTTGLYGSEVFYEDASSRPTSSNTPGYTYVDYPYANPANFNARWDKSPDPSLNYDVPTFLQNHPPNRYHNKTDYSNLVANNFTQTNSGRFTVPTTQPIENYTNLTELQKTYPNLTQAELDADVLNEQTNPSYITNRRDPNDGSFLWDWSSNYPANRQNDINYLARRGSYYPESLTNGINTNMRTIPEWDEPSEYVVVDPQIDELKRRGITNIPIQENQVKMQEVKMPQSRMPERKTVMFNQPNNPTWGVNPADTGKEYNLGDRTGWHPYLQGEYTNKFNSGNKVIEEKYPSYLDYLKENSDEYSIQGEYANGGYMYPDGGKTGPGGLDPTKPTRQDSLDVYNSALASLQFYDSKKQFTDKTIDKQLHPDHKQAIKVGAIKRSTLLDPKTSKAQRDIIVNNKTPKVHYINDLVTGMLDPNAPLQRYDERIEPQGQVTYAPKDYQGEFVKSIKLNGDNVDFNILDKIEGVFYGPEDNLNGTKEDAIKYNTRKNRVLKEVSDYTKVPFDEVLRNFDEQSNLQANLKNNLPGNRTELPYYDPIAIAPFDILKPEQQKERLDKYGPQGIPTSYIDSKNPNTVSTTTPTPQPTSTTPKQKAWINRGANSSFGPDGKPLVSEVNFGDGTGWHKVPYDTLDQYEEIKATGGYINKYATGSVVGEDDKNKNVVLRPTSFYNPETGLTRDVHTSSDGQTFIDRNDPNQTIQHQLPEFEVFGDFPTQQEYMNAMEKSNPTEWARRQPATGRVDYVPVEMALLPANLPFQAATRLGKAALFGAEVVNPIGGFGIGNIAKQSFSKAPGGTRSLIKEIKGERAQGEANRQAIKEGNEWLQNWINNPHTQQKINVDMNKALNFTQFLKDPQSTIDLLDLIKEQSKTFKPNSKEYSLLKQLAHNIKQYTIPGTEKAIHQGNKGVSYMHSQSPEFREYYKDGARNIFNRPFNRFGSWISRNANIPQSKRKGITIHEGTHDWVSEEAFKRSGMRNTTLLNMNPKIKNDFLEWEELNRKNIDPKTIMGEERALQAYLADPTEMHARIMELRQDLGITPDYKMDEGTAKKIVEWIEKGGSSINPKFLNVIDKDAKKLSALFNRYWAVAPLTIGAGALQQYNQPQQQAAGGYTNPYQQYAAGGPYKEKEDVFESPLNEGQTMFQPETKWYQDWINDPEYAARMEKNFKAPGSGNFMEGVGLGDVAKNYNINENKKGIQSLINTTTSNLGNIKTLYNRDPAINESLIDAYKNKYKNDPEVLKKINKSLSAGSQGWTDSENKIVITPNANKMYGPSSVKVHEDTHATGLDAMFKGKFKPTSSQDPEVQKNFRRIEQYPFLMQMRYDQGFKPGEEISPERLKQIRESGYQNHLFKNYNDDEISNYLNTLASNTGQQSNEQYAARGGYYAKGGPYQKPNGILYPEEATSKDIEYALMNEMKGKITEGDGSEYGRDYWMNRFKSEGIDTSTAKFYNTINRMVPKPVNLARQYNRIPEANNANNPPAYMGGNAPIVDSKYQINLLPQNLNSDEYAQGGYTNPYNQYQDDPYLQYANGGYMYGNGGRTWKNIGAGAFGVLEGVVDTTFGWIPGVDMATDMAYKGLQKLGGSSADEIREQDSIHGYGQAAGSVTSAIVTGGATTANAISEGAQGLGQGISKGNESSAVARGIGTGLGIAGGIVGTAYGSTDSAQAAKAGFKTSEAGSRGLGKFAASAPIKGFSAAPKGTMQGVIDGNAVSMKPGTDAALSSVTPTASVGTFNNPNVPNINAPNPVNKIADVTNAISDIPKSQEPPPMAPPIAATPLPKEQPQTNYDQFAVNPPTINTGFEAPDYDFSYNPTQLTFSQGGNITNNSLNLRNTMRYKRFAQGGTFDQYGINMIPDSAGLHHESAYGGVPIGPNALAEGGEIKMDTGDGGQYIVSDQVDGAETQRDFMFSKGGKYKELNRTLADGMKQDLSKYTFGSLATSDRVKGDLRRPNDSYGQSTVEQIKQKWQQKTEYARQRSQQEQAIAQAEEQKRMAEEQYIAAYGGRINPKKYPGLNMTKKARGGPVYGDPASPYTYAMGGPDKPWTAPIPIGSNVQQGSNSTLSVGHGNVDNTQFGSRIINEYGNGLPNDTSYIYQSPKEDYFYNTGQNTQTSKPVSNYNSGSVAPFGNNVYQDRIKKLAGYARGGQIDYTNDMYAGGGPMPSNLPQGFKGPSAQNRGGMYAYPDGGMMPPEQQMMQEQAAQEQMQQQGGGEEQMMQMVQQVAQAIAGGAPPEQVMQQLVQSGVPPEQAQQIIQAAMQMAQQQQQQQPMQGQGQMMADGGMMQQQSGAATKIAEALQQGAQPQEILQQLIDSGMPQEQAMAMMQAVMGQLKNQMQQQPPQQQMAPPQPMMAARGGYFNGKKQFAGGGNDLPKVHLAGEENPAYFEGVAYDDPNDPSSPSFPVSINMSKYKDYTNGKYTSPKQDGWRPQSDIIGSAPIASNKMFPESWQSIAAGTAQALPGIAGAAFAFGKLKDRKLTPSLASSVNIDYSPERVALREEGRRGIGMALDTMKRNAPTSGSYMNNAKEAVLKGNKIIGGQISKSWQDQKNEQAKYDFETGKINTDTRNKVNELNEGMYQNAMEQGFRSSQDAISKVANYYTGKEGRDIQRWQAQNTNTTNHMWHTPSPGQPPVQVFKNAKGEFWYGDKRIG
jgi:hypothetical protein